MKVLSSARNLLIISPFLLLGGGYYAKTLLASRSGGVRSPQEVSSGEQMALGGISKSRKPHKLSSLSLEQREEVARDYLTSLTFPHEREMLRRKLEDEFNFILSFPDNTERDYLIGRLARSFGEQFFSSNCDDATLVTAIAVYECALLDLKGKVHYDSLAYDGLLKVISSISKLEPELALKREKQLILEYKKVKSDLFGKIAGTMMAQRLKSKGLDGLNDLKNLDKDEIRCQAERLTLIDLAKSEKSDCNGAYAYYFGSDCHLGAEHPFVVQLISSSFATHPEEISSAVFESASGLKRDTALVQMALRMGKSDPDAARAWINEISDPSLRNYADDRFKKDKPLALKYLPESVNGPDPFLDSKTLPSHSP